MKLIATAALFAATALALPNAAEAGCSLNLRVANTGHGLLQIDLKRSASRVKLGTWLNFKGRISGVDEKAEIIIIEAGDVFAGTLSTDFGCSTKRRLRWAFACGELDQTGAFVPEVEWEDYTPSDDGYSDDRTVSLEKSRCKADY